MTADSAPTANEPANQPSDATSASGVTGYPGTP
jgi:hypothetical protein